jgi:hypothetical protein
MTPYAQTNLQLFNQLCRAGGYSMDDLAVVHKAYEVAIGLFSTCYRPSGKPFLAHAVGTASILGSLGAPAPVVAAGLLHAAYTHGEFGTGWRGISGEKRKWLRQTVGSEVEELISMYTALDWKELVSSKPLDTLSERQRQTLLIRLANALEDHLDLGILYCGHAESRRTDLHSFRHQLIQAAEQLGYPELAAALERTLKECASEGVPSLLRGRHNSSFHLGPASHRPRAMFAIQRALGGPLRVACRRLFGWRRGNRMLDAVERALAGWDLRRNSFRRSRSHLRVTP